MLAILAVSTAIAFVACLFIIHGLRQGIGTDRVASGVQKFHALPTPRLGGIAILLGCIAGAIVAGIKDAFIFANSGLLLLAALPIFIAGLLEDLTHKISPRTRLIAAFIAPLLGTWLLGAMLPRLDVPYVDHWLASSWLLSGLFTLFAVAGLSHAINIIDGFNGLAGVVVLLIFGALGYVSYKTGDSLILAHCLLLMGATLGFLAWNYPFGRIFAGDAGAYLWGFMVAETAILLVMRNPKVSPWFPLLVAIYPVWETLFSIYRKKWLRGMSPGSPDGIHLHMLVYKRLLRICPHTGDCHLKTQRNAMTSPYLWALSGLSIIPALAFWDNTPALAGATLAFIAFYNWLYRRIVRFRTPRWLIVDMPR